MRYVDSPIWHRWRNPTAVVALGWVTIVKDWWLTDSDHINEGPGAVAWEHGPVRTWIRPDNDQIETILPNVESLNWSRSVESQGATGTCVLGNMRLMPNGEVTGRPDLPVGQKGYMSPRRGGPRYISQGPQRPRTTAGQVTATALWAHEHNEWAGELVPNAMLRTYEGLGDITDPDKTLWQALADGDVALSGIWLVGDPDFGSDGRITLPFMDLTKLLVDQKFYPPWMKLSDYPLRFARWVYDEIVPVSYTDVSVPGPYAPAPDQNGTPEHPRAIQTTRVERAAGTGPSKIAVGENANEIATRLRDDGWTTTIGEDLTAAYICAKNGWDIPTNRRTIGTTVRF